MNQNAKHILITGAGLGGLTLALCLARAGSRVTVLEQAKALGDRDALVARAQAAETAAAQTREELAQAQQELEALGQEPPPLPLP